MATSAKGKRRRGHRPEGKKQSHLLMIGVGILLVALIGYGAFQVLGNQHNQGTSAPAIAPSDTGSLESLSIAANQGKQAAEAIPVTDRETRYLGPASDPATVSLAEAGQLGQPVLLWFHADW